MRPVHKVMRPMHELMLPVHRNWSQAPSFMPGQITALTNAKHWSVRRILLALLSDISIKIGRLKPNAPTKPERTRKRRIGPYQFIDVAATDVQKLASLVNRPKLILCSVAHVGLRFFSGFRVAFYASTFFTISV